jgi:5'-nucleotidase
MNPGGLRANLAYTGTSAEDPDGNVTFAEAAAVQPFANTLVTMTLDGAQLKQVLEEQWQPAGSSRPFLKLGVSESLKYTYDPAGAPGDRVDAIYVNGVLVDATDTFTVTVNSFLASGGDNFATLATGTNKEDSGKVDLQSMVDYFQANPVASPDYAQRAVGVSLSAADADGYSPGDTLTVNLSSLLFSNGEPNAGTATVSLNGAVLGSAVIDPTIVDTTDEVGRATLSITIPEGTPGGATSLLVTVAETGTSIEVPIEIVSALEPITVVKAPKITGALKVGKTVSVNEGTWSVGNPTFSYQWNRNGAPIDGATAENYTITAMDAGAALSVTVTAGADGYANGTATSAEKTVSKLSTRSSGSLAKHVLFGANSVQYTVSVTAPQGAVPGGSVTIYDGLRAVQTVELGADGTATVTLTGLSRGLHVITTRYAGSGAFDPSFGLPDLLIVF